MPLESQVVTWTLESDADSQWAVFMRVGGIERVQVTPLFATREACLAHVKLAFAVNAMGGGGAA
jgi:hypothetical protein